MNKAKAMEDTLGFFGKWGNNLNANKTVSHALGKDLKSARRAERTYSKASKVVGEESKVAKELAMNAKIKGDSAKQAGKAMKGKNISTTEAIKGYRNSRLSTAASISKDGELGKLGKLRSDVGTVSSLAGSYFLGGTAAQNATRIGTASAGYMGLNLAGRGLTGGSLTKNNKGERDIAGIPFI